MSYDLVVFDPAAAPRSRKAFLAWFEEQSQTDELFSPADGMPPDGPLRAWFAEMIKTFPPLNGPLASDDYDDPKVTD